MVTRANTWQDAYKTGTVKLDLGDGIVVPLPVDGDFGGEPGPPGAGVPAGGTSRQVIRKDAAGATTEWATLTQSDVGLGQVNNTSDADKPISTPAQAALDAKAEAGALAGKVDRGELFFSVKDFGAVGNDVADDTAAINAADEAAFQANFNRGTGATVFMPHGRYKTTGTVNFRTHLEASQATIRYHGTGVAVQVGTDAAGVYTIDKSIDLPRVVCMTAPENGWDGTSVGVKVTNLNQCRVDVQRSELFEKGLLVTGNGGGTAYTEFYLGSLWINHENVVLDQGPAGTGWVNQNQFYGGRATHSTSRGIPDDPNASLLRLGNTGGNVLNPPDGNSFYGFSMEGVNDGTGAWARNRIIMYGRYTQFFNCRFESISGIPVLDSREYANDNIIWGGYHANKLKLTGIGGAVKVNDGVEGTAEALDTSGPVIPTATDTTLRSWVSPVLSKCTYDPVTGLFTPARGRWRIKARVTFAANATGTRTVRLYAGATIVDQDIQKGDATAAASLVVDASFKFDGTTSFRVVASQTSGADLGLSGTAPYVKVQAVMA